MLDPAAAAVVLSVFDVVPAVFGFALSVPDIALSTLAQWGWNGDIDVTVGEGVTGGAVSAFLSTLVLGAILVAVVPNYTDDRMTDVIDDPFGNLVYGLLALVALILVIVALAITIVGILLVIPLAMVAYLVWAVGATIAYLAIALRLVDRDDGWAVPLLLAAGLNGIIVLTGVGSIVGLLVGAAGTGAVLRDAFE